MKKKKINREAIIKKEKIALVKNIIRKTKCDEYKRHWQKVLSRIKKSKEEKEE